MRSHEVTSAQALLNARGNLAEPGWSRRLVRRYERADIKAPKWRVKEWGYCLVVDRDLYQWQE